jgi:hypothetical protein
MGEQEKNPQLPFPEQFFSQTGNWHLDPTNPEAHLHALFSQFPPFAQSEQTSCKDKVPQEGRVLLLMHDSPPSHDGEHTGFEQDDPLNKFEHSHCGIDVAELGSNTHLPARCFFFSKIERTNFCPYQSIAFEAVV